ncbi:MAG TPA: hypothetical protein VMA98_03670 [Candidatus Acidoferrales bacterium]|nr:hypothetical protein [Candidatus Acidoferrales bacterium]
MIAALVLAVHLAARPAPAQLPVRPVRPLPHPLPRYQARTPVAYPPPVQRVQPGPGYWGGGYGAWAGAGWGALGWAGLTQTECGPPGLVEIFTPDGGKICAYPNSTVGPGVYYVDPTSLSLVS